MAILPLQFLGLAIAFTTGARILYVILRNRRRDALQSLAREWRMHYSAHDRFDISDRLAERFPVPGAAEVRAVDVIYGTEGEHYRFIFTAEYTQGVVRGKHRFRRVVTFREPKGQSSSVHWSKLILAPEELEPIAQYEKLHDQISLQKISGASPEASSDAPLVSQSK
jgi:hypothetical protein